MRWEVTHECAIILFLHHIDGPKLMLSGIRSRYPNFLPVSHLPDYSCAALPARRAAAIMLFSRTTSHTPFSVYVTDVSNRGLGVCTFTYRLELQAAMASLSQFERLRVLGSAERFAAYSSLSVRITKRGFARSIGGRRKPRFFPSALHKRIVAS